MRSHRPARLAKPSDVQVPAGAVPDDGYREVGVLVTPDAKGLAVAKHASYAPEIVHCKSVPAPFVYPTAYGEGTPAPTLLPR